MNEWMFNDTPAQKNSTAIGCQKKVNVGYRRKPTSTIDKKALILTYGMLYVKENLYPRLLKKKKALV